MLKNAKNNNIVMFEILIQSNYITVGMAFSNGYIGANIKWRVFVNDGEFAH